MKRWLMTYLASYLIVGGLGFALLPAFTLKLFFSNGNYGDVMPRVVGVFMTALGGLIAQFVRRNDYAYYGYSVYARIAIVGFVACLYVKTQDPLFLVLNAIVLIGLIPSVWHYVSESGAGSKGP